jgi:plastin-1
MHAFNLPDTQKLVINSAKAIGCSVVNVGAPDLTEGKVHLVLGLVWQIIRIGLLAQINLKNHPYLIRLLEPGESLEDFLKLPPDQILLRWFNYHLKEAGWPRRVANFSGDIKDSENYTVLLAQIAPKHCNRNALSEKDLTKRAEQVLQNADKLQCRKFLRPTDIVKGNAKLNLAFVANLFNTWPGLEPPTEIPEIIEETREEKAFRMWLNSLGVDPYVNHLYDDLEDGIIILQMLDAIKPGIVSWSKVNRKPPLNKYKKVENCNYAVTLGKQLKFSLVGIAGQDIQEKNKKLMLALIWQAMRFYVMNFIKTQFQGKDITEDDIIRWANQQVGSAGKSSGPIHDFKDKKIATGVFLLDLLAACQPESVDNKLITPGQSEDDARLNAQYAISCARKMGCTVFCLWEDIVEVKPKMILTFIGAVMARYGR